MKGVPRILFPDPPDRPTSGKDWLPQLRLAFSLTDLIYMGSIHSLHFPTIYTNTAHRPRFFLDATRALHGDLVPVYIAAV
jgi:hypothetical protein